MRPNLKWKTLWIKGKKTQKICPLYIQKTSDFRWSSQAFYKRKKYKVRTKLYKAKNNNNPLLVYLFPFVVLK